MSDQSLYLFCICERSHKKSAIDDTTQLELREVNSTGTLSSGEKALAELRKRKLIIQKYVHAPLLLTLCVTANHLALSPFRKSQWFTVHKGPNFSTSTAKPETDLTVDMLTSLVSTASKLSTII